MAVVIDASEVRIFLDDLAELPDNFDTRKLVTDIANTIAARIKVRTGQGKDVKLKPFAPYSDSYKAFRAKKGRQTSPVNLQFTGRMLAGVFARTVSPTEARVGIGSAIEQRKGIIHQLGLGKMPKREWFGVSPRDTTTQRAIDKLEQEALDRAIDKTI